MAVASFAETTEINKRLQALHYHLSVIIYHLQQPQIR